MCASSTGHIRVSRVSIVDYLARDAGERQREKRLLHISRDGIERFTLRGRSDARSRVVRVAALSRVVYLHRGELACDWPTLAAADVRV